MWIKTANARLIKTKGRIAVSAYQNTFILLVGAESIASGTREEMTAVLDRIARALAAALPFLDLGTPENHPSGEPAPDTIGAIMQRHDCERISVVKESSGFLARMWKYDDQWYSPPFSGTGPTPDAAIANLKPTGK